MFEVIIVWDLSLSFPGELYAFAFVFWPLSEYRGFYQGLKDFISYGFSQTLEQLVRILMLLGLGALCVYILKMDNIWAVRMAVFSTGLAALVTILYFVLHDRHGYTDIRQMASVQESQAVDKKELLKEMAAFGLLI